MLGLQSGYEVHQFSNLTSVGVTGSAQAAGVALVFQITTTGVSTNVVIRMEGSLDNTNFFNLDENELDTTLTANGTFAFALSGTPVKFVRVRLVSISGGTPTVASKVGAS